MLCRAEGSCRILWWFSVGLSLQVFRIQIITWPIMYKSIDYRCFNDHKLINMLLLCRAWVVRRSTRLTYAATQLPSRSCSSTEIQNPQYPWSSLCHPPTTSVRCQLHPPPPPAYRGSPFQRQRTPSPIPPPIAARTPSAQTTRWCCQNMMKCWRRRPPLLMCRWVRAVTFCVSAFLCVSSSYRKPLHTVSLDF